MLLLGTLHDQLPEYGQTEISSLCSISDHQESKRWCHLVQGRGCSYTNVTYPNCRGYHYATSVICSAKKMTNSVARSKKDGWRILQLEMQQKREKKQAAEKAREAGERVEVTATAEIEKMPER